MIIYVYSTAPFDIYSELIAACHRYGVQIFSTRIWTESNDPFPFGWQIQCQHTHKLDFLLLQHSEWLDVQRGLLG
jgi:hypothetical protein